MAHFALSNIFWVEGEKEKAKWHIETAYRLDPHFPVITNNLAWILANTDPPDLERAQELAENALQFLPNNPDALDTYGTILMLRKNYNEAIPILQKALSNARTPQKLHKKLAVCYQEINQPELARLHRKKAVSKEKKE